MLSKDKFKKYLWIWKAVGKETGRFEIWIINKTPINTYFLSKVVNKKVHFKSFYLKNALFIKKIIISEETMKFKILQSFDFSPTA